MLLGLVMVLGQLPHPPQPRPKQIAPFSFNDIRLGMSMAEFKAKHPVVTFKYAYGSMFNPPLRAGQALCKAMATGVSFCNYDDKFSDVSFKVTAMFVDGKLAAIAANPGNWGYGGGLRMRDQVPTFVPGLIGQLGQPTKQFGTPEWPVRDLPTEFYALRWENDSSVAEYQDHFCGPFPGGGWSKAILELLDGSYCSDVGDSDTYSQPMIIYVHKTLGKVLSVRLDNPVGSPKSN